MTEGGAIVPGLFLEDDDIDRHVLADMQHARRGDRHLGESEKGRVAEAILAATLKRLRAAIPPGFEVAEISLEMLLGGRILGAKLDGKLNVKLRPTEPQ